jgi:hypothetical protein
MTSPKLIHISEGLLYSFTSICKQDQKSYQQLQQIKKGIYIYIRHVQLLNFQDWIEKYLDLNSHIDFIILNFENCDSCLCVVQ